MKTQLNLVRLTTLGLAVFVLPASAQLLGGGIQGTLGGTLRSGIAGGGLLEGNAQAHGGLHGGLDGGIRETAGAARETTQETAGKLRAGARSTTERTREVSAEATAAARSKVAGAQETASEAPAAAEGSATGGGTVARRRGNAEVSGRGDADVSRDGLMAGGDLTATGEFARKSAATAPAEQSSGN